LTSENIWGTGSHFCKNSGGERVKAQQTSRKWGLDVTGFLTGTGQVPIFPCFLLCSFS